MSTIQTKRNRSERVATLKLPPGMFERGWITVRRADVLARVALCFATAFITWIATGGWRPALSFREGDMPTRNVVARVAFERTDEAATLEARNAARRIADCVYVHDPRPLIELQQALKDRVFQLRSAETLDDVDPALWSEFTKTTSEPDDPLFAEVDALTGLAIHATGGASPPSLVSNPAPSTRLWRQRAEFARFKRALADDPDLTQFLGAVKRSLAEIEEHGLLESLQHDLEQGNQSRIKVFPVGNPTFQRTFDVDDVRIGQAMQRLEANLRQQLPTAELAGKVFNWMRDKMPLTLKFDPEGTREQVTADISRMPPVMVTYKANETVLARANERLTRETMDLLQTEHDQFVSHWSPLRMVYFSLSKWGMYTAFFGLCGLYIYFRRRRMLRDLLGLAKLQFLVLAAILVSRFTVPSRSELIPLLLFSMTAVTLYQQELALLLSTVVAFTVVLSFDLGIPQLVTIVAGMATTILLLRHIRTRTKLTYVAIWTAVITGFTSLGVHILQGESMNTRLFQDSLWVAGCAVASGLLMTALLPFVERFFDVQTDLTLLELGDAAHPLLQELVKRAPGTYNHSINVASIAQAAAEAINANGLLVRVGAYFHDIGKMLKPGYFVENQGGRENCHESLLPAMSTLVIIAHVKDGADLARQHNLPDSIIDFIQQHHGTTLVEYFYRRANQQRESDPRAAEVDEGSYRYPGPKPQTREAAVLMLADAVESAARSLVDPAPSRIESLVQELAMKRLLDGQFDQCGLTLRELRTVQDSLIKSLIAVYHGRIKYPGQQSA
jgi:putative nucleotidyltransferase with HDIG domain